MKHKLLKMSILITEDQVEIWLKGEDGLDRMIPALAKYYSVLDGIHFIPKEEADAVLNLIGL